MAFSELWEVLWEGFNRFAVNDGARFSYLAYLYIDCLVPLVGNAKKTNIETERGFLPTLLTNLRLPATDDRLLRELDLMEISENGIRGFLMLFDKYTSEFPNKVW